MFKNKKMLKGKDIKSITLNEVLLEERTLSSLKTEELLELYDSKDLTAALFCLVQDEGCRRLKG